MRSITISHKEAFALSDKIRIEIIKLLQTKPNTINYVCNNLQNKKAESTVRHHCTILLKTKLLKITKMVPVKGSYLKYYKSTITIEDEG